MIINRRSEGLKGEKVIEDNQMNEEEPKKSPLSLETQNKILYGVITLILMGISFAAGSFTAGWFSNNNNKNKQTALDDLAKAAMQVTPPPPSTPVPITEAALSVINFSGVSPAKKSSVIAAFSTQLCGCGCKMSVAECIIKDPNCPMWKDHVTKFQEALGNGKKPDFSKVKGLRPQMIPMSMGAPNGMTYPNHP
jgi:hypothetical protein